MALERDNPSRRFHLFLEPPSPCPLCNCSRVIRVGLVDDVGFFRCANCDGTFTIPHTARASHTDHSAHFRKKESAAPVQ
jgi:transposase-like protein